MPTVARSGNSTLLLAVCLAFSSTCWISQARAQSSPGLRYEPILEWNGPFFVPFHSSGLELATDTPPIELPFQQPRAIAVRSHSGRDVVYVADSGRNRIQVFEANATFAALSQADLSFAAGLPAAGEFGDQLLRLPEFQATAAQWIVPRSEAIYVDGALWRWVDDLAGYTAADRVYTVDYASATDQPEVEFPVGSLRPSSLLEIHYLLTDLQDFGGGAPAFGSGDVDYGLRNAGTSVTKVQIDETSGGPASWEEVRALAVAPDPTTPSTDLLFVVDAADASGAQNEEVFSFTIDLDGNVTFGEAYDDHLSGPYDAAVLDLGPGKGASAFVDADTGPFDKGSYPFVVDANQVTGRAYTVAVAAGLVTITDTMTGRVLVDQAPEAAFADPFLGIPGLSLPLNAGPWPDGTTTVHTSAAHPGRFLVIADTGNDRLKLIGLPSGATAAGSSWDGDWLSTDRRTVVAQPVAAGALGQNATEDFRPRTPSSIPEDWTHWTNAAPLAEGTLDEIVFDPDGTPSRWRRVDDVHTAAPTDSVYEVDWELGRVRFGDGIHGALPPASTDFEYSYAVTPDLIRFGSSGTGAGRFTSPRGVSGLWNDTLGRFDLYVADSGNHRIQKLSFVPADTMLGLAAEVDHLVTWEAGTAGAKRLRNPSDVEAAVDGDGTTYLAVSDPGNHRVVLFRDVDPELPGVRAGVFDASVGQLGNQLGNFVSPGGVAFLANGADLDLYVADESRGVVTKYEEGPTPSITLLLVGDSELPACFPPGAGYPIRFQTTHPPLGGWVDFYFDTQETFDPARARLALPGGSVAPTATFAYWDFAATPGGSPAGGSYYLFARLKDATGTEVAWDQSFGPESICIDPSIVPALRVTDAIDGDHTLYLQNGLVRDVDLEVAYPDSLVSTGYYLTYDPQLVQVVGITPGTAWDGIGYTSLVFQAHADTVAGVVQVNASALDAPTGLSGAGPYTMATLRVRARANAISASARFKDGVLTLDKARSTMADVRGNEPLSWSVRSCNLRIAYLGDIATTGAGAEAEVPNLEPRPDGRIDFEDQMAFTLGWNGASFVRDRIADMGPATGTSPNLWPVPDVEWDVDDIVVFTSQFSFFAAAGWNSGSAARPADFALGRPNDAGAPTRSSGAIAPRTSSPWEATAEHLGARVVPAPDGIEIHLDARDVEELMGARLELRYPAASFSHVEGQSASLLRSDGGQVLHLTSEQAGRLDLGLSRLCSEKPGVSGTGPLAVFRLRLCDGTLSTGPLELRFDLRDRHNRSLESGTLALDWRASARDLPRDLFLGTPAPNPVVDEAWIEFGIPEAQDVELAVFAVDGRRVATLAHGNYDGGTYRVRWDGRGANGRELVAGRYYLELRAGTERRRDDILILR